MNPSKPKTLLRALLVSYLLSGIALLLLTLALYKLRLREAQINFAVYAVYLIACLAGGFTAGRAIRSRRFFWGLLSGLLYFLVLLAVSWLMKQGGPPNADRSLTVLAFCAVGGMLGGILS